jgi:membrane protein/epoxyqueuosine reductase
MRWARTRRLLREALQKFLEEDSLMVSASIAYHSLLGIFPLLLLLLGICGIYIRRFEMAGHLSVVLQRYLPIRIDVIMQNLVGISRAYGKIGLLSFLLLLWSSSGVFLPLEKALNRAWNVTEGRRWWRSRLLALEMSVIMGCLILTSTACVTLEIFLRRRLEVLLGHALHSLSIFIYHLLTAFSSFSIALLMFLVVFERLPNRPMDLRRALPGALLTALLWETARGLFTIFLPYFNYRQVYGSIGVVVSLMTWAYISSAIMLFGAQVSRSLYGSLKLSDTGVHKAIPLPPLETPGT